MPGFVPFGFAGAQPQMIYAPSTTQQHPLGMFLDAADPDFFGYAKFIYGKAAAAINNGRMGYFDYQYTVTDIPNTANTGFPIVVNPVTMAINTFGWFQVEGMMAVQAAASVAIGVAVGVGAAGQAGTNAAGKQILGARVVQPSTYAPTLANCTTVLGSPFINVPNVTGLVQNLAVTGTGIPGSSVISAIDASGNQIKLNNNATASGSVTLTFTWTGYLLVQASRPFVQGAIT